MSLPLLQHAADLLDSVSTKEFIKLNHHFIRPLSQEFWFSDHWCFSLLRYIKSWIGESISSCQELNAWFFSAPQFPASPLALADALARAEHPLLRFFTAVRQAQKKEARPEILWKRTLAGFSEVGCPETVETFEIWNFSRLIHTMKDSWYSWLLTAQAFLVAVALCLQSLRQRFSWMRVTEPVLDRLSSGTRLFVMAAMAMVETLKLHFSHLLSSAQVMTFKTGSSLYRTRGPSWSYLLQVRNRPSILNRYCLEEWSQVIKASFLFWRTHKRSFKSYQSRHEAWTMCSALNDQAFWSVCGAEFLVFRSPQEIQWRGAPGSVCQAFDS